jgi:hypothetical protein
MTAAKFKPLIFSVWGLALSNGTNIFIFMIFGYYPSSCLLFKTQLNSIGLSVPRRKHITSPLQAPVNAVYRFVFPRKCFSLISFAPEFERKHKTHFVHQNMNINNHLKGLAFCWGTASKKLVLSVIFSLQDTH